MKIKFILASIVAAAAVLVGCTKEGPAQLKEVQVDKSYVAIAPAGGSVTVNVTAQGEWALSELPEWLTASPAKGSGNGSITFTAGAATDSREVDLSLACGGRAQSIKVFQQTAKVELPVSSCAEINALSSPDSKTYRAKGRVTNIINTTYGNWYLEDETGKVYIYGTLDKTGAEKNFLSLGIEEGDEIIVEGPKTTYNGTVELVNVTVIKLTKSLLKVESPTTYKVEKEDSTIDIKLTYKGKGVKVETDQCWLTLAGIDVQADTTYVKIHVAENTEDTRTGYVTISSASGSQASKATVEVTQATGLSMYTLPFEESFQAGQGAFEIKDITARADGKDIWSFAQGYGMKASAGSKVDTKSMLISPKISLAGVASPVLTFEHCGKYCGDQAEELTVWASTDGGETWSQLLIPNEHPNNYGWVNSGEISLAKFVGNDYVQVALQYVSNTAFYGTWEVKNLKLEDRAPQMTNLAELANAAASNSKEYTVTLKDAIVSYVNGSNAFIQDATGAVQVYSKTHGLVAGDVLNGTVKFTLTLYSGYAEATAIDFSAATKTTGTVEPIVLTVDKLNKDYARYCCCLVKVEGATFATGSAGTAKVNDTMSQNGASVATRTQVNTVAYEAGKAYDVLCVPVRYNGAPQVSIYEAPVAK